MPKECIAIAGLESVGKSALFRCLTGQATGDEQNFRGSTVMVRAGKVRGSERQIVDLPGLRLQDDAQTTRMALEALDESDALLLVVRATHLAHELETLSGLLAKAVQNRKLALAVTFSDRMSPDVLDPALEHIRQTWKIPVYALNAREASVYAFSKLTELLEAANTVDQLPALSSDTLPPAVDPPQTVLEKPVVGPILSVGLIGALFGVPVWLAYLLADNVEGWVDDRIIDPLAILLENLPAFLFSVLMGDYGVISLGWYSFVWAFPVVLLIGISVALTEESGLKDRMTAALDPVLRRIGLNGRDLVPVLSGFGCNVVAVFQSRGCSSCTRKTCMSMIAFGSACSYQIGSSLALFSVAGAPWLFAPYLLLLFVMGAIHVRVWHRALDASQARALSNAAFLQKPAPRAVYWRVKAVVQQFLLQAMPIFLLICVVGAILDEIGLLGHTADLVAPLLRAIRLPAETAPGVIFSIIRKDGLLVLNAGGGEIIRALSRAQVFVLVYFASTFSACLVTLWTIGKEAGIKTALQLAGQQATTSIVSSVLLAWALRA